MSIFQAIILGLVQGIAEFLPISSSGHLIFLPHVFGWAEQGYDFDVLMHVATLLAIIWVFWKDLLEIARGLFDKKNTKGKLGWKIAVSTIPVVIVGLVISSSAIDAVRVVKVVALNLIIWGIVLWLADWYSARLKKWINSSENVSWGKSIAVGLAQALALIPGSSRSGLTISMGLFSGMDRKTAAKFSFLLGIPAIAGAGLLAGLDVVDNGLSTSFFVMAVGFITAFLSGIFSIKFLLKFVEKADYKWFAVYRVLLGIALLLFL